MELEFKIHSQNWPLFRPITLRLSEQCLMGFFFLLFLALRYFPYCKKSKKQTSYSCTDIAHTGKCCSYTCKYQSRLLNLHKKVAIQIPILVQKSKVNMLWATFLIIKQQSIASGIATGAVSMIPNLELFFSSYKCYSSSPSFIFFYQCFINYGSCW